MTFAKQVRTNEIKNKRKKDTIIKIIKIKKKQCRQQHYKTRLQNWNQASMLLNAPNTTINVVKGKVKGKGKVKVKGMGLHTQKKEVSPGVGEEEDKETINQCEKCKSKVIDVYQKQIRGADEPMTCFLTCKCCKHRWTE